MRIGSKKARLTVLKRRRRRQEIRDSGLRWRQPRAVQRPSRWAAPSLHHAVQAMQPLAKTCFGVACAGAADSEAPRGCVQRRRTRGGVRRKSPGLAFLHRTKQRQRSFTRRARGFVPGFRRLQILVQTQQGALEGRDAGGPFRIGCGCAQHRAHRTQLGVEVIEEVEHQGFAKQWWPRRAELQPAVMADDEMLDHARQSRREPRLRLHRLLGHILLGLERVRRAMEALPGFPPRLARVVEHLIVSHHGRLEFGSPRPPLFREALVFHFLDDLDSKLGAVRAVLGAPASDAEWTARVPALERALLRLDQYLKSTEAGDEAPGPAGEATLPLFGSMEESESR